MSEDGLTITGGILATVYSGGTFPIIMGGIATIGGTAKLGFDLSGNYETSDKIPTTLTGVSMNAVNIVSQQEVFSKDVITIGESIENVISFKPSNFKDPKDIVKASAFVNLTDIITDIPAIKDATTNLGSTKINNQNYIQDICPKDNTTFIKNYPKIHNINIEKTE